MHRFEYFAPTTLDETLSLLMRRGDGVKLLAGGTDLLVQMKEAGRHPAAVVSLHALHELQSIEANGNGLRLGASVDMGTIAGDPRVQQRYTALAEGAGIVGSVQTRNMATIGGNVCNAAPSADTIPPLVVLDAVTEVVGQDGKRELLVEEMVVAFRLPEPPPRTGSVYQRHTPRKIMDIAVVGVGIRLVLSERGSISDARICLGAVAPTVIRATEAEQALTGQSPSEKLFARAAELAQQAARPISDVRGSAEFRRYLVGAITTRCLDIALERAKGS